MIKAYYFIKRERLRKKVGVYRLLVSITFDFTNLFYLCVLLGYFLYSFISYGEIPSFYKQISEIITPFLEQRLQIAWLLTMLPPLYVIRSFQRPGVLFSSAEWLLAILPYRKSMIWLLSYAEKIVIHLFFIIGISFILYFFVPISLSNIIFIAFSLWLLSMVMVVIQWKLFNLHLIWKIITMIILVLISGTSLLINESIVFIVYIVFILGLFIYSLKNIFSKIEWQKVIASTDFLIWNMALVSQATKIKFKKDKQPALLYRLKGWKKQYPYDLEFAYNRLWYVYFEKHVGLLLQIIGAILLLVSVISYFRDFYFGIAVTVAIYIQSTFLMSLFRDRLTFDILNVLPWNVHKLRETFINWAILLSLVLLIPIGLHAKTYFEIYFIFFLVFSMFTFYIFLRTKLNKQVKLWDDSHNYSEIEDVISYILLLIIIFSVKYVWLIIVGYGLIVVYFVYQLQKVKAFN